MAPSLPSNPSLEQVKKQAKDLLQFAPGVERTVMTKQVDYPWLKLLKGNPLPWLLQKNCPPVRHRVLTELLGRPKRDPEVVEARKAIGTYEPVRRRLAALQDVPVFSAETEWKGKLFKTHFGDFDTLHRFGVPPGDSVITEACSRWLDVPMAADTGCYQKQMIGGIVRYMGLDDPRVAAGVRYVMDNEGFFDGNRPGELRYGSRGSCCGSHSCFSTSIRSLWAIMGVPKRHRDARMTEFLARGADFLRNHHLYLRNHGEAKPISPHWLTLHLPFALGWQTDLLDLLDVASQIGLANDPCVLSALQLLLAKQTNKGRWPLEVCTPSGRNWLSGLVKDVEPVGKESKWVTLSALLILKRCCKMAARAAAGESPPELSPPAQPTFATYPFRHSRKDEQVVRAEWEAFGMTTALTGLERFGRDHRLKAGWHWGFVLGPKSCREWLAAQVRWVPRKGLKLAWPVARVFFLCRRGQFSLADLEKRLKMAAEDEHEKPRFNKYFWVALWRIRIAKWRDDYDEVAVTLRDPKELKRLLPILADALVGIT